MGKSFKSQEEVFASDFLTTMANALMLNGLTSDSFLRADVSSFPWSNDTVELGRSDFRFSGFWTNQLNGNDASYIMYLDRNNLPTVNSNGSTGFDLGAFTNYWRSVFTRNLYADKLYVTNLVQPNGEKFSHKDLLDIGTNTHKQIDSHISQTSLPHGATVTNTANRLVARDSSGNINVSTMNGIAVQSLYADLAEKYTTYEYDEILEGTVFKMSSNSLVDIEICDEELCNTVVGVYSCKPAFLMNKGSEGISIGLKGRLPCRVIGPVDKGDILVSTKNGCLRKALKEETQFKVAYCNKTCLEDGEHLLECIL